MLISRDPNTLVNFSEVMGETTLTDTTIREAINSQSIFIAPSNCAIKARG